jgi:hypothetical protein
LIPKNSCLLIKVSLIRPLIAWLGTRLHKSLCSRKTTAQKLSNPCYHNQAYGKWLSIGGVAQSGWANLAQEFSKYFVGYITHSHRSW